MVISNAMYFLLKPLLFLLSPERAHVLAMRLLSVGVRVSFFKRLIRHWYLPRGVKPVEIMGLKFPNRVGLAAGFDKDGKYLNALACIGFGFIEVGTVTPKAQPGNPKPRLFRLPADEALINRMGFNNEGLEALASRLRARKDLGGVIIGGNIGKNKNTPNEEAENDYLQCIDALHGLVDYFVVNVSSPNTPGLRELQEKEPLTHLLGSLQAKNSQLPTPRPILLKIAPDLTDAQLDDIAIIVQDTGIAGVIATNTTISREGLVSPGEQVAAIGAGGLSGLPVRARSTEVIRYLRQKLGSKPIIIGVGGIDSPESAKEKILAGANLVQIYTGFIYKGPGVVRAIAEAPI